VNESELDAAEVAYMTTRPVTAGEIDGDEQPFGVLVDVGAGHEALRPVRRPQPVEQAVHHLLHAPVQVAHFLRHDSADADHGPSSFFRTG